MLHDRCKEEKEVQDIARRFVTDAISRIASTASKPNQNLLTFVPLTILERGPDDQYRQKDVMKLVIAPDEQWLSTIPGFSKYKEALLEFDPTNSHLDRMVGYRSRWMRFDIKALTMHLIQASILNHRPILFNDRSFEKSWSDMMNFFECDSVTCITIIPLPQLTVETLPLTLNNQLELDWLSDDEINRCFDAGILRSTLPMLPTSVCSRMVGIRQKYTVEKVNQPIASGVSLPPQKLGDGSFGRRPGHRGDLVLDDFLSAIRLWRNTSLQAVGIVGFAQVPFWADQWGWWRLPGHWPDGGRCELNNEDLPGLRSLWVSLEAADLLKFSIRWFSTSFERRSIEDRIVSLMISAEALFLIGKSEPGELSFRIALRSAKFIKHEAYSEKDIYLLMRAAYQARSAVVHGSSPNPKKTRYRGAKIDLTDLANHIEILMRSAICRALSMADITKLTDSKYWDDLLMSD